MYTEGSLAGCISSDEAAYISETISWLLTSQQSLPQYIVHNDPKMSNIIFDSNGSGTLIDLDTCARGSRPIDMGDALRSWCKVEVDGGTQFSYEYARCALEGYFKEAYAILTPREVQAIPAAVTTVSLELAMRYAIDSVEGRTFAWDASQYASAREHNHIRTRESLVYARSIDQQRLNSITQTLYSQYAH
jgi:Ser/Thr protein kinase RdoA (MazF antagonist)